MFSFVCIATFPVTAAEHVQLIGRACLRLPWAKARQTKKHMFPEQPSVALTTAMAGQRVYRRLFPTTLPAQQSERTFVFFWGTRTSHNPRFCVRLRLPSRRDVTACLRTLVRSRAAANLMSAVPCPGPQSGVAQRRHLSSGVRRKNENVTSFVFLICNP